MCNIQKVIKFYCNKQYESEINNFLQNHLLQWESYLCCELFAAQFYTTRVEDSVKIQELNISITFTSNKKEFLVTSETKSQ